MDNKALFFAASLLVCVMVVFFASTGDLQMSAGLTVTSGFSAAIGYIFGSTYPTKNK